MAGDSFLTFIDGFGQFAHRDWPGKIHTDQDLTSQRSVEAATLVAPPGPDQRSTYGGWTAGPRFEATGFFRVVQHAGGGGLSIRKVICSGPMASTVSPAVMVR